MTTRHLRTAILAAFAFIGSFAHTDLLAQGSKYPFYHSFDIGLGRIGYFAEKNISDDFSLGLKVGIDNDFGFMLRSTTYRDSAGNKMSSTESGFRYSLSPSISLGANWYYNLIQRRNAGRNTMRNASDYISVWVTPASLQNLIASKGLEPYIASSAMLAWGSRRILGSSLMYHYQIGGYAAYVHDNKYYGSQWTFGPSVSVGVGLVF